MILDDEPYAHARQVAEGAAGDTKGARPTTRGNRTPLLFVPRVLTNARSGQCYSRGLVGPHTATLLNTGEWPYLCEAYPTNTSLWLLTSG